MSVSNSFRSDQSITGAIEPEVIEARNACSCPKPAILTHHSFSAARRC